MDWSLSHRNEKKVRESFNGQRIWKEGFSKIIAWRKFICFRGVGDADICKTG